MGLQQYLGELGKKHPNIAYVYAALGYTFNAFLHISFKYVTRVASPFHLLFMRAFSLFLFNSVILRNCNESPYIKNEFIFRQMIKRLMFSTSYAAIMHYSVKYLPISTTTTLGNTGPIFIFFIEAIYYKKALNKISLSFAIFSFIGVVLIMQPEFLFKEGIAHQIPHYEFFSVMVLYAAFCFAMTMLYIHDIGKKVSTIVNLHYSYMGHMIVTCFLANFQSPVINFPEIDLKIILCFLLVVVFALLTQYMIYAATALKEPSKTMPLGYLTIFIGFASDIIVFDISFNLLSIVGMVLTSAGLLTKLFIKQSPSQVNHFSAIENGQDKSIQIQKS